MTVMNREIYEALKEAKVSEKTALSAAESVASYDARFAEVDKKLTLIQWMVGFNLAVSLAALWKLIG